MRSDPKSHVWAPASAGAVRPVRGLRAAAAGWLLWLAVPAAAAVGVDYGIDAVIDDHTRSPVVTQDQEVVAGHLPATGQQRASASRRDAFGHAIGEVSFDASRGRIGYFAETLAGTPDRRYRLNLGANYDDALTLVTTAGRSASSQAVLTMTVEGDFAGTASQGGVTMTFSAATGQSAFLHVLRMADPLNPGFDVFTIWNDILRPPVSVPVPAGVTQHFVETLSLTVPVTAVPAATSVVSPAGLCVGRPPGCGVGIDRLDGSPAPQVAFSFDVTVLSAAGRGMPLGESRIDLAHTASLGVLVPEDTYFLFETGALAGDPRSALAVVPVSSVPEPSPAAYLFVGLGLLLARRGRRCGQGSRPRRDVPTAA